jgi:hypothetical protein
MADEYPGGYMTLPSGHKVCHDGSCLTCNETHEIVKEMTTPATPTPEEALEQLMCATPGNEFFFDKVLVALRAQREGGRREAYEDVDEALAAVSDLSMVQYHVWRKLHKEAPDAD